MTYRALAAHLHATADHARGFFVRQRGVSHVVIEGAIDPDVSFRPTFHGRTRDHHTVCVEVTDSAYTDTLDVFVLDCQHRGMPVKLYLAVPAGSPIDMGSLVKKARSRGVGVLEIGPAGGCTTLASALSLSLTGLSRPVTQGFPARYRQALADAEETFLNGDPVKGCGRVYDEIEEFTRRLAERAQKRGFLSPSAATAKKPNFKKGPWKVVLEFLREHLDYPKFGTLDDGLLARVIGLTHSRNQSGHKVSRKQDLVRRDSQLRTRFEDAVNLLDALIDATRKLRI